MVGDTCVWHDSCQSLFARYEVDTVVGAQLLEKNSLRKKMFADGSLMRAEEQIAAIRNSRHPKIIMEAGKEGFRGH
jgi:hypothetical protein